MGHCAGGGLSAPKRLTGFNQSIVTRQADVPEFSLRHPAEFQALTVNPAPIDEFSPASEHQFPQRGAAMIDLRARPHAL